MTPESRPNNVGKQLEVSVINSWILFLKVMSELKDVRQLFRPGRLDDLLHKGAGQLRSIIEPTSDNTDEIEQRIAAHLQNRIVRDDDLYLTPGIRIGAIVFNRDTKIRYCHWTRLDREVPVGMEEKWRMSSFTERIGDKINFRYPELGYKDSKGIINAFQKKRGPNQSLGGVKINNELGSLKILNYPELVSAAEQELNPEEVLIMANWYMDSDNQNTVSKLETGTAPLNGMGVLQNFQTGGEVFFSINCEYESHAWMKSIFHDQTIKTASAKKRTIAAMCNLLTKIYGCDSWRIFGVDYTGGGTYPPKMGRQNEFFSICRTGRILNQNTS